MYSNAEYAELSTLKRCHLLDEKEQTLHSLSDYKNTVQRMFTINPVLEQYSRSFALPAPGDWWSWYFVKKIVAEAKGNIHAKEWALIPEMGPFHIHLNFCEQIQDYYHFIFAEMYHQVFGKVLPKKPKCWKTEYCLHIMFLGWVMVREDILEFFKDSKDHEVILLFYLLEELLPIAFYFYTTVFRGGDFALFANIIERLSLIMICFRRRHYDKAMLSWLSDRHHYTENFPEYISRKTSHLAIFTEKMVEIWHSILRRHISLTDDGKKIEHKAKTISANRFGRNISEDFLKAHNHPPSDKDLTAIANKVAEYLVDLFKRVAINHGKSQYVSAN